MKFSTVQNRDFFPTPFIIAQMADEDIASINPVLEKLILQKEKQDAGVKISNSGGWQSDANILVWGGDMLERVVATITDLVNQTTLVLEGNNYQRANIKWRVNGWANVNRKGNQNVAHTHPGAYWSAVYYVKVPKYDAQAPTGGELELLDPRGSLPLMYCPNLRFGVKGATSAGTSELHKPVTGQCVIFPSWLSHAVSPYIGDETRISIALNFS
ncbi:MAG: 2OG-Fe(II) oxygenase family protein, partial [Alphaproteobacteria bacterium]|nr:2OG-Fe(II) oxygenase family protein [Alphaproteobacteria bacterium]